MRRGRQSDSHLHTSGRRFDTVRAHGNFGEMTASPEIQEIAVITGASTGIGAATAQELARKGFHVLAGVRREVDAEALRGLDVRGTGTIEPRILDITVESDVAAIADRVAHDPLHRPLRALVNNAGIAINAPVETLP